MPLIRVLEEADRDLFKAHLLGLPKGDRYTRFCTTLSDEGVARYVDRLDFSKCDVLAVENRNGDIVGCAEVFVGSPGSDSAELAFSVLPEARGQHLGHALADRAIRHAKTLGVSRLTLVCLSENAAMKKIARDTGMALHSEAGEIEGVLNVPQATPSEHVAELFEERCAEFAHFQSKVIRNAGLMAKAYSQTATHWLDLAYPWHRFVANPLALAEAPDTAPERRAAP